ncbi:alpha/beta hydrolase [Alkalilimnicola ehrlichii MLHE-1]|uniref:Alpha/beta hydrolase fold protein n=1 Tax=Alkalilimnicola ehrlichii (strain ATCC BAA-1101 / DSM 17681 / MLHE-1) TaxID=187272 RepID=Q0A8G0_ALKEH|nr:alpha/beta fold hydrolase [Alkalilimnicola ehrlichii]ABI56877.1 alpha/beta hydrolase fold protein [Alkalilimnicola ehrlichii MLHE-1]
MSGWWLAVAGGVVGAGALLQLFHRRLQVSLTAPRVPPTQGLADHGVVGETVRIPTYRARTLVGWWLPGQGPGTVVITHGWGANRELMLPLGKRLQAAGWNVLLFDARNHGDSEGDAFSSMPRFAEDTEAALAWVRARPGMAKAPVALLGHSVGAAAVLLAASRRSDISAVVSLSAFASPDDMMRRWLADKGLPFFPVGWYVLRYVERVIGHRFDAIAPVTTLPRVRCPVLLVHGRDDQVVPLCDAERLLASRGDTPAVLHLLPGDHDLSRHLDAELPELLAFLDSVLAEPTHAVT